MTYNETLRLYADSWILWAIILLGLICYALLINFLTSPQDRHWHQRLRVWLRVLPVLLSALPLLGLLGTITGLMKTFREMSLGQGLDQQTYLSSGISEALLTTQLGLVLVIPGLLLLAWLKACYRKMERVDAH